MTGYEQWLAERDAVLVTRHSEYYLAGKTCVAVRDAVSGRWFSHHLAIGAHLLGSIRRRAGAAGCAPDDVTALAPGDRVVFSGDLMTSALVKVD